MDDQRIERPWYAKTWVWLLISLISVLLGIFVLPWLFGGVFLIFLPFVWVRPPARRRRPPEKDA